MVRVRKFVFVGSLFALFFLRLKYGFRCCSIYFQKCPKCWTRAIMFSFVFITHSIIFGLWTRLDTAGLDVFLDFWRPLDTFGDVWTRLDTFRHAWIRLDNNFWTHLDTVTFWTRLDTFGHV